MLQTAGGNTLSAESSVLLFSSLLAEQRRSSSIPDRDRRYYKRNVAFWISSLSSCFQLSSLRNKEHMPCWGRQQRNQVGRITFSGHLLFQSEGAYPLECIHSSSSHSALTHNTFLFHMTACWARQAAFSEANHARCCLLLSPACKNLFSSELRKGWTSSSQRHETCFLHIAMQRQNKIIKLPFSVWLKYSRYPSLPENLIGVAHPVLKSCSQRSLEVT